MGIQKPIRGSLAIVVAIALSVAACDDDDAFGRRSYELQEVKGDVYLINKRTGQLYVRQRDRLVELKRYADAEISSSTNARWLVTTPVSALVFNSRVKLRNGMMYYQITVSGRRKPSEKVGESGDLVDPNWKDYWEGDGNWLNVDFVDKDDFSIATISLGLKNGIFGTLPTHVVDANGQVSDFEYEGSTPLQMADYTAIQSATVRYYLEKPTEKKSK